MTSRIANPWVKRVLMLAVTVVLLVLTARLVGTQALLAGSAGLTPVTVVAALGCGLATTSAQALRWWLLAAQKGIMLSYRRALADCYASSLGNMVLPGGLAGDMGRVAVYRHAGDRHWWSPVLAVGAERATSTTLLLATAAVVLAPVSVVLAVLAASAALVFLGGAVVCMRGLTPGRQVLVWFASSVGVSALLGLYLIAMSAVGGPVEAPVAVVGLAAMSIPLGIGGWGVREFSVSVLAVKFAVSAEWAVTASTAYGLLATISTLPGAFVLLAAQFRSRRTPGRDADRSGAALPR